MVKICVAGCLHGELDKVYADISEAEKFGQFKTDLVLCCGDFQSIRNPADLSCMSVPPKFYAMGDFWRYYAEERQAPVLTLFVGGNHESSGYLQELPYGGWVAPNIWYMGYASVMQFGGLRIAGLSGIYKQHDYTMGHFEHVPFSESTKRSVYHVRNLEVFRLGQIRRPLDIVISHDWPRGIYRYGNSHALIRKKPFFAEEIGSDALGSPPAEQLLCRLRPRYWFSAHLHCSFAAAVEFSDSPPDQPQVTRFLALDKCLPRRDYLRFVDIEPQHFSDNYLNHSDSDFDKSYIVSRLVESSLDNGSRCPADDDHADSTGLFLDPEWLCILRSTNHLMCTSQVPCILPGRNAHERCDFSVTNVEIQSLSDLFGGEFSVPDNFERTAPAYKPDDSSSSDPARQRTLVKDASIKQQIFSNPQTELLCAMLDLVNPNALLLGRESFSLNDLSSEFVAKEVEREAEEAEEFIDADEQLLTTGCDEPSKSELCASHLDTSHMVDPSETSWVSSHYSSMHPEYDPLESAYITPLKQVNADQSGQSVVSHNPEELNLDDIYDGQDDEIDPDISSADHDDKDSPIGQLQSNLNITESLIYSPQPVNSTFDVINGHALIESLNTGSPDAAYSPTPVAPITSHNVEEIELSDATDDSEQVTI